MTDKPQIPLLNGDKLYVGDYGLTRGGEKVGPFSDCDDDFMEVEGKFWFKDGGKRLFRKAVDKDNIIAKWHSEPAKPKTWGEMTDAEKGALLLADHEGKAIESAIGGVWGLCAPVWQDCVAYRVKPDPAVKTVKCSLHGKTFMGYVAIDLIDGKPDWSSLRKWEE